MIQSNAMISAIKSGIFAAMVMGLIAGSCNSPSWAGKFAQNHPRRAEVLGRDNRIGGRINRDYGNLGGNYGHLAGQNQAIRQQEQRDAWQNGGYITKGQQGQLNREQNSLAAETYFSNRNNQFVQNHPRRSEVLGRDANLNYSINKDQGKLGGNYGSLESQDKSIMQQEQADAKANGGYITRSQRQQLNQEENGLRQQVNQDYQ